MIEKEDFKMWVSEIVHMNPDEISFKDKIRDVGIDSLYLFLIIENFESEYHVSLDFEELMKVTTLEELYEMVTQ
jgi:acyl carrier protein